jgi:hypothetical protein
MFTLAVLVALAGSSSVVSASAQTGLSGTMVQFEYTLTNVTKGFPRVVYSTGVIDTAGGSLLLDSGVIKRVEFLSNAWMVLLAGTDTLNADITDWRLVSGPTVTGTAYVQRSIVLAGAKKSTSS